MSLFSRRRRPARVGRSAVDTTPAVHMGKGTVVAPTPASAPPRPFYPPTARPRRERLANITTSDPFNGTTDTYLGVKYPASPLDRTVKYPYGKASLAKLAEATIEQQELWMDVADYWDVSIIEVYRSPERQAELYAQGPHVTTVKVSKHNSTPSEAVDAAPYPIDWNDIDQFIRFTYFVKGMAAARGMKYTNGADWDNDNDYEDHTLLDWVHWQT